MTIDLVTGPLGTGKSYYLVRKGVEYLQDGKMAVFNFELAPDFSERIAFHRFGRFFRKRAAARAESIDRRVYTVPDLAELLRLRVRREEPWIRTNGYGKVVLREGIVFLGLDEAHQWINARLWTDSDRLQVVKFFALARKRGFHVYLGSQRDKNLDAQIRELFEDHIKLNNLKRSARMMGIPVIPWNWFVALRESHHYPGEISGRDIYLLNWCKDLYDTMDTASFGIEEDPQGGAILLPGWTEDGAPPGIGAGGGSGGAAPPPPGPDGAPPAALAAVDDLARDWADPVESDR
jgi:hypothetical protein